MLRAAFIKLLLLKFIIFRSQIRTTINTKLIKTWETVKNYFQITHPIDLSNGQTEDNYSKLF